MNYFAHALPFLDEPYFAAGTAVPDWLSVVDRRVRVRRKHAEPLAADADEVTAAVARGVIQHLGDDARFHEGRCFVELSLGLTARFREVLEEPSGYRPSFLGHLVVELLLDAALVGDEPARLEAYYRVLDAVEPQRVEQAVNRMAPRPTARLAEMISRFCQARILWDYLEDAKLLPRLNQVMRRVGFEPLPDDFRRVLPEARELVAGRRAELLAGIPVAVRDAG